MKCKAITIIIKALLTDAGIIKTNIMKLAKYFFLVIICIICLHCRQRDRSMVNHKETYTKIPVTEDKIQDTLCLSSFTDSISHVRLETNEKCLIGNIKKIAYRKNRFYIFDTVTESIVVFDQDGNFLFKINKTGKGPGEYINIEEFFIHNQTIHIYDDRSSKVLRYDLEGNFLSSLNFKGTVIRNMIPVGSEKILSYIYSSETLKHSGLWVLNNKRNSTQQLLKINTYLNLMRGSSCFYYYQKQPSFFAPHEDAIYSYSNNKLKKRYVFSSPNKISVRDKTGKKVKVKTLQMFNGDLFETSGWIYSTWSNFQENNKAYQVIYSKDKNKTIGGRVLRDDMGGVAYHFVPFNSKNHQDVLIAAAPSKVIKQLAKAYEKNKTAGELSQILKKVNPSDNPVLQLCHLK